MPDEPTIARVRAGVLAEGNDGRHSALWTYMRRHWATMVRLRDVERVSYPVLAKRLAEVGLRDNREKPPTGSVTRRTYLSVKAFMARPKDKPTPDRKDQEKPALRPLKPGEVAVGVRPVEGEVLPPKKRNEGSYNRDAIRRLQEQRKTIEAEPEQPRRRFRKIATFRGEEEG